MKLNRYSTKMEILDIFKGSETSIIKCKILEYPVDKMDQLEYYSLELGNSDCANITIGDIFRTTLISTSSINEISDSGEMDVVNAKVEVWDEKKEVWNLLSEL